MLAAFLHAAPYRPAGALGATPVRAPCDAHAWRQVVQAHLARYPEMEVEDLYKLLHQGVFGSEHAVPDREAAAEWLREEIASLEAEGDRAVPTLESVAPDAAVVRVHLRPFLRAGGDPEALLDAFVTTASRPSGDAATFRCAADAASGLAAARWGEREWPTFVERRLGEGLPAVHHSEAFRRAYRPAYRVVEGELAGGLSARNPSVAAVIGVSFWDG
jgi:hypothetical protein